MLVGIRVAETKESDGWLKGLSSSLFRVHTSAYGWRGIVAIIRSYNGFEIRTTFHNGVTIGLGIRVSQERQPR